MSHHTDALLQIAESQLGYGEGPGGLTKFGQWYQQTHAKEPGFSNAAWCDMFVSWAATQVGQQEEVGQYAWTVDHAKWFKSKGAFGDKPVPGAIVFFDWDGSDSIDAIDHVGLVKKVINDHTIQTIEGNISNAVVSKTRSDATIVGYGYPEVVRQQNQQRKILLAKQKDGAAQDQKAAETDAANTSSGTTTTTTTSTAANGHEGVLEPLSLGGLLLPAVLVAAVVKSGALRQRLARLVPSRSPIRRDED